MAYEVGDFGLIQPFPVGIVGFYCFHSLEWKCSSWYQSSRHALFQPVLDLFILLCFINFLPFPKYCRCKRSSCCFSTFCTDNVCQSLFCSFVTSSAHHLWTSCNFASVILEEQASQFLSMALCPHCWTPHCALFQVSSANLGAEQIVLLIRFPKLLGSVFVLCSELLELV